MKNWPGKLALVTAIAGGTASRASAQSLTTLFASNNSGATGGAVFFDLDITNPILVHSIDTNTADPGPLALTVYVKPGSYAGSEQNLGAWMPLSTGTGAGAGQNLPSSFSMDTPFLLAAGAHAMAIVASGPGSPFSHRYTNGTGANQFYSNADLSITLGAAQNTPFTSGPISPRVWNGTIHYQPALPSAVGACCFTDGSCLFITLADCLAAGGAFRGENVACAQANCPQPGACCFLDGSCTFILHSACIAAGGLFHAAMTCVQANCPQPGACCFSTGACTMLTPSTCASQGGVSQGAGTTCAASCPNYSSITTGFSASGIIAGEGYNGHFFDITDLSGSGLTIRAWEVHSDRDAGTPLRVRAYYKVGTWSGFQAYPPAWTLLGEAETQAQGIGSPTPVVLPSLTIPANALYGIRIGTDIGGLRFYSASASVPVSNSDIRLEVGGAQGTLWTGFFAAPRGWSGTVYYEVETPVPGACCLPSGFCSVMISADCSTQGGFFRGPNTTCGSCCYPNCDGALQMPFLDIADFTCFLTKFAAGDTYANCDGSTLHPVLNVADFGCFLSKFAAGCSVP